MHCTDDRGRRVPLLPQRQIGIVPGIPSPIPMEARSRMFADAQRVQFSREVMIASALGLAGIIAWGFAWYFVAPHVLPLLNPSATTRSVITGTASFAPLPFVMWFIIRSARQKIARVIAKHGFCASCGYALRGIPIAADRCTVCPECGSAWRIEPSTTTTITTGTGA